MLTRDEQDLLRMWKNARVEVVTYRNALVEANTLTRQLVAREEATLKVNPFDTQAATHLGILRDHLRAQDEALKEHRQRLADEKESEAEWHAAMASSACPHCGKDTPHEHVIKDGAVLQ